MLAKINRLPSCEIGNLRRSSQILNHQAFRIYIVAGKNIQSRCGINVSSKVAKLSVKRNRIKRLVRVAMQQLILQINKPIDILIQVKRDLSKMKQVEVNQLLQEALLCSKKPF